MNGIASHAKRKTQKICCEVNAWEIKAPNTASRKITGISMHQTPGQTPGLSLGYAPCFLAFFAALSFSCFTRESTLPPQGPLKGHTPLAKNVRGDDDGNRWAVHFIDTKAKVP